MRKCDRCDHLLITGGGTHETCWARFDLTQRLTRDYVDERLNGNEQACKAFRAIVDLVKIFRKG